MLSTPGFGDGAAHGPDYSVLPTLRLIEERHKNDPLVVAETELRREARGGAGERVVIAVEVTELPETVVESELVIRIDAIVCDLTDDAGAACTPRKIWLRVPVRLAKTGKNKLDFAARS